ncbi:suppressor of fused [Nesidiocoris tenuis]|uniref:Suppressor of fused n=1 Tax=Nesidiocoris tenuis TaxID=355587 RepID=A0ABN7BB62_9HEMI|nr:suppressor of fused [Nesidiocoris tenuis]
MVETQVGPGGCGLPFGLVPVSPPGLEALYMASRKVYPDQPNPLQVAAVVKYWLGGPDPLDYISMYSHPGDSMQNVPPHWHYISFGLSDLHGDGRVHERAPNQDSPSGYGFELTFRLKKESGETSPPTWPANLLQSLAKYVFHSGNTFCTGDHVSWHAALDGSESQIQHMLLTTDVQLQTVRTPVGTVDFVQVVGVFREELQAAQRWNGSGVLNILKNIPRMNGGGPWLVTDMRRGESMIELDPGAVQVIEAGIDTDGSNLSGVTANCSWAEALIGACGGSMIEDESKKVSGEMKHPIYSHNRGMFGLGDSLESDSTELLQTKVLEGVQLTFNMESGSLLPLVLRGRIKHGRHFTFKSAVSPTAITFAAESVTGTFVDADKPYVSHGPWLQVLIKDEDVDRMSEELQCLGGPAESVDLPKTFYWGRLNLTITVVPDTLISPRSPLFNVES